MSFLLTWAPFFLALLAVHVLARKRGRVACAHPAPVPDDGTPLFELDKRVRNDPTLFGAYYLG